MVRVLQIAVAAQCFALGFMHLFGATPINDWLVMNASGAVASVVDQVAGLALLVISGMVLAKPMRWLLVVVSVWFLLFAGMTWLNHAADDNRLFFQLAPAAQAVRYLSPIALAFLLAGRARTALWILAIAAAATFIGHGIKDVLHYPPYLDLINNSVDRFFGVRWPIERTQMALRVIGIVDIVAAVVLLFTRWRWVALIMAVWGLVAAGSRMTAGGWELWPETLLRVCNGAAPFLVFLLIWKLRSASSDQAPDQAWDFAVPKTEGGTRPAAVRSSPASPERSSSSFSSAEKSRRDIYG